MGGERWHDALPDTFGAVESFDLATGAWVSYAPMPTTRHGLGLTVYNGEIWAIGGGPIRGNSYTDVVEVFTP